MSESWTDCAPASEKTDPPKLSEKLAETFNAWLKPIRDQLPSSFSSKDAAAFGEALKAEAFRRFDAFLKGVRAYQNHPLSRQAQEQIETVWERGTTRLLDYAPGASGPVVLVVPSLVNRFEILDLEPERSFLRFLARQGFRPLVVDWQSPGDEEKQFNLTAYITERLLPIMDYVKTQTQACHVFGYCMGGLMAMALAQLRPTQTKTLSLMGVPWDFAVEGIGGVPSAQTLLGTLFLKQAGVWDSYLEKVGYLPASFLQTIFTSFQPAQVLQKFMSFASSAKDADAASRFVLTEDWLNNGVALALPVMRECLYDWYRDNTPAKMAWQIGADVIDPRKLGMPTYLLIAQKDRIVPPASSKPLAELIRNVTVHAPDMGHIGLMIGNAAPQNVWKPFVLWLLGQEVSRH